MPQVSKIAIAFVTFLPLCLGWVSEARADLVHRYSFTNNATDSVGNAHGTLLNGATVSGGNVLLSGGGYVSLPIGSTIGSLTGSTFESWVTWETFQPPWSRIFDFGSGPGVNMFLTPRNDRLDGGPAIGTPRFAVTAGGFSTEQQSTSANPFPVGSETHVAVTINASDHVGSLYINGTLAAANINLTLTPSSLGNTTNNWLGRSQYPVDPFFAGSINEFRIYDSALSATQIANNFSAGPNSLTPVPEPTTMLLLGTGLAGIGMKLRKRRQGKDKQRR